MPEDQMLNVTFKMTGDSAKRYLRLMEVTEASNDEELVSNALRLYESAILYAQKGREFLTRGQDGKLEAWDIFEK